MTADADLLAAIDKARDDLQPMMSAGDFHQSSHLDTLRAILDLHKPRYTDASPEAPRCWECDRALWPCLTVQVVADALTRMGVL